MIGALTNHLWQSTIFVLAAALVAAALRRNGAHIRHAVWVVASLKFLVPFALLMSLGGSFFMFTPAVTEATAPATTAAPDFSIAVDRIAQPFTSDLFPTILSGPQPVMDWTAIAMAGTWACGFVVVALMRLRGWRRVRAAVRASVPLSLVCPLPVRSSPGLLEPGVVGVWRPVLLMPAAIERHLTPAQLQAVLEHELCHVRRRDNLTSAVHMAVEAAFWFHPLVWWIGARMIDERERACDEHVLRVCSEPRTYAESILNVCKLYVESPLACVSGVTGSDLKKRIAAIMVNRIGLRLNFARKAALTMAAMLAIGLPLIAGMLTAPLRASAAAPAGRQSGASTGPTFDVVSIKPCPEIRPAPGGAAPRPGGGRGGGASPWAAQTSPGYVHWDCATLAQLIEQAYADVDHPLLNTVDRARTDSFQPRRVRGGPSWVEKDKFTIEARASLDVTNPALRGSSSRSLVKLPAAMSQALRATIEDRFQLQVRRATEQQDMYALTIAKSGLNQERMKATKPGDCLSADEYFATDPAARADLRICGRYFVTMTAWEFRGGTLQQLATALSSMMDLFVVDRTALDGTFTYVLEFEPASEDNPPGDGRFIRALERLGLKIERTKGPAEYLAIERVEKLRPDAREDFVEPPARAGGAGAR